MGWSTLLEIARENARLEEEAQRRVPVSCPIDGAVLDVRGELRNCPMGNYRWEPGIGGQELTAGLGVS